MHSITKAYDSSLAQSFIQLIIQEAKDNGCKVFIHPYNKNLKCDETICLGYFDPTPTRGYLSQIHLKSTNYTIMIPTLVHEYIHMLQWKNLPFRTYTKLLNDKNYIQTEIYTEQKTMESLNQLFIPNGPTPGMIYNSDLYINHLRNPQGESIPSIKDYRQEIWIDRKSNR